MQQTHSPTELALLNHWQRGFPLVDAPFATIAAQEGMPPAQVLATYAQLQQRGSLSRIGAVFAPGAGGASLLAAMAVPPQQLEAVPPSSPALPGSITTTSASTG